MSYITVKVQPIEYKRIGTVVTNIEALEIFALQYSLAGKGGKFAVNLCAINATGGLDLLDKTEVEMTVEESTAWVEDTFLKDFVLKKLNATEIIEQPKEGQQL